MTPVDRARHARTIRLPGVGLSGQSRIGDASVLVVGAGGLGSPVLLYLAAAGVGRLGIVDPDVVAVSNLARQILYGDADTGESKTGVAARALGLLNPAVRVGTYPVAATAASALDLLRGWDVVVDATDEPASRYVVSDAAAVLGIPEVWGAVLGFEGQVSVFGTGPGGPVDYRDLHPVPPVGEVDSCATVGVLGPVCGVIGSAMAVEVLKLLTGVGESIRGRVLHYDGAAGTWSGIPLRRRADRIPVSRVGEGLDETGAHEIEWRDRGDRVVLDVREPDEHAADHLPGDVLIPLGELLRDPSRAGAVPVLVYCATGRRSARAASALRDAGVDAVSLRGGITALR